MCRKFVNLLVAMLSSSETVVINRKTKCDQMVIEKDRGGYKNLGGVQTIFVTWDP